MRVDAHCHLWSRARGDYDWLDPANADLAPLMRDFAPNDLIVEMAKGEIDKAIVVQAAPTVAETEFLLSLADQTPQIAGVVGWVNMTRATSAATLERLARNFVFKGIRPMLQDEPSPDWILTQPHQDVVDALIDLDLTFDALVRPEHLPHLMTFAKANPDLAIVIDHAAKPVLSDLNDPSWDVWRSCLQALAQETATCCKLSGLVTERDTNVQGHPTDDVKDIFAQIVDWFGPDRLMWGSDWPVITLASDYVSWLDETRTFLQPLPPTDLNAIEGKTAERFYKV